MVYLHSIYIYIYINIDINKYRFIYIVWYVCSVARSCPTLFNSTKPARLLCPWNFPGKNTGVGCHFLLQRIFLIQRSNLHLQHWQADSIPLSHLGSWGCGAGSEGVGGIYILFTNCAYEASGITY